MIPRVKLRASFSCLCSEGFIFPTSGSQTVTSSFVEVMEGGSKKFAPDSYIPNNKKYHHIHYLGQRETINFKQPNMCIRKDTGLYDKGHNRHPT